MATTSTDPNILRADVKNTGNTSISEHDEMDFIVNYSATGTLATVIKRLTYVPPPGPPLTNGLTERRRRTRFKRGIWDPGETLSFDARLATQQATATSGVPAHLDPQRGCRQLGASRDNYGEEDREKPRPPR